MVACKKFEHLQVPESGQEYKFPRYTLHYNLRHSTMSPRTVNKLMDNVLRRQNEMTCKGGKRWKICVIWSLVHPLSIKKKKNESVLDEFTLYERKLWKCSKENENMFLSLFLSDVTFYLGGAWGQDLEIPVIKLLSSSVK